MAYDIAAGKSVLFGGLTSAHTLMADTWEFGTNWAEVTSSGPPARQYASMVYDSLGGKLVLFGGQGHATDLKTLSTWNVTMAYGPRDRAGAVGSRVTMAYDSARNRTACAVCADEALSRRRAAHDCDGGGVRRLCRLCRGMAGKRLPERSRSLH